MKYNLSIFNHFQNYTIGKYDYSNKSLTDRFFPPLKTPVSKIRKIEKKLDIFLKDNGLKLEFKKLQLFPNRFDCPYYSSSDKRLSLPHLKNYRSRMYYYLTVFHELSHAIYYITGEKRNFGYNCERNYDIEEIIAETTSILFLLYFKIIKTPPETAISYIKFWADDYYLIRKLEKQERFNKLIYKEAEKGLNFS